MKQERFLIMKRYFLSLAVIFALLSCSSSDDDNLPQDINASGITGVWESGNYFISFNNDGFCSAYIADNFIDCGDYIYKDGMTVSCSNTYFSRNTTYAITYLSTVRMDVDVTYTDLKGKTQNINLSLARTEKRPARKENYLIGKSCESVFSQDIPAKVLYSFTTFQTASKTTTQENAAKWPLSLFYVYCNKTLYYQQFNQQAGQVTQIGGWNTDAGSGKVTVWTIKENQDGSIEFDKKITK